MSNEFQTQDPPKHPGNVRTPKFGNSLIRSGSSSSANNTNKLSYPNDITENELGYVRYDVYKHSSEQYRPEGQLPTSLGHINLHMPAEIGDTIASEWSEETDHISGGAALAQSGSALFDSVKNSKSIDFGAIAQTMSKGTLAGISSLGNMGKAVFEGADFVTRGIQRRMGQAMNPHEQHFYKGVAFRTFSFSHKLIAFSPSDSEVIRSIIYNFKYFSLPSVSSEDRMHFKYPSEFHIGFYNKDVLNSYLPIINQCVCTNVAVNFTGSSTWSQFASGAPTDVELTLEFTETILPTKEVMQAETKAWFGIDVDARTEDVFAERDKIESFGGKWVDKQASNLGEWVNKTRTKDIQ